MHDVTSHIAAVLTDMPAGPSAFERRHDTTRMLKWGKMQELSPASRY